MTIEQILLLAIAFGGGAFAVWYISGRRKDDSGGAHMQNLQQHITDRLDKVTDQLDRRLQDNVKAMNESGRSVREVLSSLGKLESSTSALKETTAEISSFQKLLKSPKVRGGFGEVLLTNLLAEVLPRDWYETQYTMPSGGDIADAIIRLQDGYIVAVDAKFPLANYEVFAREQEPEAKRRAGANLIRDIKKHVGDISKKYIAPRDKTLDYAFMYIPMEGVYYETMVRTDEGSLWDYCLKHHVVPVSPNNFLAYLRTILIGLRGMKIEEQAKEILESLGQVRHDFKTFNEDFAMVGKHIGNAKNRFDDSARRLDKFTNRLDQIEGATSPEIEPGD